MAFMVFSGKFSNPVFIEFLQRLIKQSPTKVVLIVDGHPVHRSAVVRDFATRHSDRLRLMILPGYCPELNPDELFNQDVKTTRWARAARPTRPSSSALCARISTARRSNPASFATCSASSMFAMPLDRLRTVYGPGRYGRRGGARITSHFVPVRD
jgi:hypothetical protein